MIVSVNMLRTLMDLHQIRDEDAWGNIVCSCGDRYYGGDEIAAVMQARDAFDNHKVVRLAEDLNEFLEVWVHHGAES